MSTDQILALLATLRAAKKEARSYALHFDLDRQIRSLEQELERRTKEAMRG